jgi:hypothetical protein
LLQYLQHWKSLDFPVLCQIWPHPPSPSFSSPSTCSCPSASPARTTTALCTPDCSRRR